MEISEPVFDRLSFEHYIRLEDSYKYNIILLCRIEGNTVRYGYWANIMNRVRYIFLNGMNERNNILQHWTNMLLCLSRYMSQNKTLLKVFAVILVLIIVAFSSHPITILGWISFFALIWYIFFLLLQIEVDNHEVLVFEFVNENNKVAGDKCFRFLSKYDRASKLDFLIELTKRTSINSVEDPHRFDNILKKIRDCTESNLPFFKVVMTFTVEDNNSIKLIQL